jgi:hypothetical protein
LFPVGGLIKKTEVRKLAKKFDLITAEKKDSQGLCFIGKIDIKKFLGNYIKPKKGKEIRAIPPEWKEAFAESDRDGWKKWISYDAVEWPTDADLQGIDLSSVLTFRMLRTDKNEATRGNKDFKTHPLKAKSRGVLPGYKDKQSLSGDLKTNSPTLSDEAKP